MNAREPTFNRVAASVAAVPAVGSLLFLWFAPSEGANIGGGMLLLMSMPVALALYWITDKITGPA